MSNPPRTVLPTPASSQAGDARPLVDWVAATLGRAPAEDDREPASGAPATPCSAAQDRFADRFIERHPAWSVTYLAVVAVACIEAADSRGAHWRATVGTSAARGGAGLDGTGPVVRTGPGSGLVAVMRYTRAGSPRRALRRELSSMVRSARGERGVQAEVVVCRVAMAACVEILSASPTRLHGAELERLARDAVLLADAFLEAGGGAVVLPRADGSGNPRAEL